MSPCCGLSQSWASGSSPGSPERCRDTATTDLAGTGTETDPRGDAFLRSLRGYLAHLRVERGLSQNTLAAYERDLSRYADFLRTRRARAFADVEEADVTAFLEALRTGSDGGRPLVASSAARTVTAVRGFHRFLLDEGLTEADPAARVRPPQVGRRLPKALSVEEVTRLLDAASAGDDAVGVRDRALLEVLYATGARISEAVGLVVDDLDADSGCLRRPPVLSPPCAAFTASSWTRA